MGKKVAITEVATKTLLDNLITELEQLRRENAEITMKTEFLATEVLRLSPSTNATSPAMADSPDEVESSVSCKGSTEYHCFPCSCSAKCNAHSCEAITCSGRRKSKCDGHHICWERSGKAANCVWTDHQGEGDEDGY